MDDLKSFGWKKKHLVLCSYFIFYGKWVKMVNLNVLFLER